MVGRGVVPAQRGRVTVGIMDRVGGMGDGEARTSPSTTISSTVRVRRSQMWNEPILSQTQTRRQHYVPRSYLKPFLGSDGKLRVSDLQEGRKYSSSLENVAIQSRFYDVNLHGHAYSAEDWLASLESDAISVLRLLLEDAWAITRLTEEQENTLARFVASLILRTPFKRQELDNTFQAFFSRVEQSLQGQFVNRFGQTDGLAQYNEWREKPFHERYGEEEPTQPASITNNLLSKVQGYANVLRGAPWRIGNTLGQRRLYTSDNPVSRYLRPIRPWWETGAFSSFQYYLPLSPDLLLRIERRSDATGWDREKSPWGQRLKKDFSESEVSMARHIISRDAFRFIYGDGLVVSKQCAVACLERIELSMQEFAVEYLGYDPNPPSGAGFPVC